MRRVGTIGTGTVLLLMLALLFPMQVRAQGPDLTMEATALYGGTSKYGEWLPVTVQLANEGADVSGQVQVVVTTATEETVYAQRLELPRGARKEATIYTLPNNFTRRLQVTFVADGDDKPLLSTEVAVRPVPNIRFVAAAIVGGGEGVAGLAGATLGGDDGSGNRREILLAPLSLATLPDRPEALRTLDLLLLSGVDSSTLSPGQRAALEQYVQAGGVLVLGGGPEAGRVLAGIPESLRPVTLTGEQSLPTLPMLEQLTGETIRVPGPYPAAVAEPMPDALVQLRQDALPLLVERAVGRGAVLWLALDPALSPFDAWAGIDEFWSEVLAPHALYPREMPVDVSPAQMGNEQLFYALQNLPSLDLPSLRLLAPLLLLYILLVGPVNYFALRQLRRMELAWVTIPLVTLLFTVGAYGIGFRMRGSDVILNQVALVEGVAGGESAHVRAVIGIFSPARRSYNLLVRDGALLSPTRVQGDPFGPGSGGPRRATIVQGDPARVVDLVVNQWSMQSVTAEAHLTEGYGLSSDLVIRGERIEGEVTNRTGQTWHDAVVVMGSAFERIGTLAPGESVTLSLKSAPFDPQKVDVAWRLFEQEFNQPRGASRQVQVRQQVVSTLFTSPNQMTSGSRATGNTPVLLAWLDELPIQMGLEGDDRVVPVGTALFYSDLPVRFEAGTVSLPRGILTGRVVENDGGTCYGPNVVSLAPDFRVATVEWELPRALSAIQPSELSLFVSQDGAGIDTPTLSFYEWQRERWVPLDEPRFGRNEVPTPERFLGPAGIVRLRAERVNRNQGGCFFFDVALKGELPERESEARR